MNIFKSSVAAEKKNFADFDHLMKYVSVDNLKDSCIENNQKTSIMNNEIIPMKSVIKTTSTYCTFVKC